MSDVHYQVRNTDNMQALIENLLATGDIDNNTIGYQQAGGMVLLGKVHNSRDVKMVENATGSGTSKGKLQIYTNKTKRLFRSTEHELTVWIKPDDGRRTRMAELETAIKDAIHGVPAVQGWPVAFAWE